MHERASQTLNRPREPMPEAFFMLAPPALAATSLMLSGPDPAWRETLRLFVHLVTMDERQTLRVMAWSIGGVVGVMFFLNAVALSLTSTAPRSSPWPDKEQLPSPWRGKEQLLSGQSGLAFIDRDHVSLVLGIDQADERRRR